MSGDVAAPCQTPATADRRGFLGGLAALLGGLCLLPRRALASSPKHATGKVRWGMTIDLDRCTGCQACAVACRKENNIAVAGPAETRMGRAIYWMDMMTVHSGQYPDLRTQHMPVACNHCDNPPCIKVCPVGATRINDEGIVAQIFHRCIGCRYCTTACPYTRRYFNWKAPTWPEEERKRLNPSVSVRQVGVVEKCTFCHQRIRAAKEQARLEGRELVDADVQKLTACASACPADAITFGNLNDPHAKVSKLAKSARAFDLQEEMGTHPKVHYLREARWGQ